MQITVEYMSHIRDAAGVDAESLTAEGESTTLAGALCSLADAHGPKLRPLLLDGHEVIHPWLMITVNDSMVRDPDTPLRDGDRLTIAVPIAGG